MNTRPRLERMGWESFRDTFNGDVRAVYDAIHQQADQDAKAEVERQIAAERAQRINAAILVLFVVLSCAGAVLAFVLNRF